MGGGRAALQKARSAPAHRDCCVEARPIAARPDSLLLVSEVKAEVEAARTVSQVQRCEDFLSGSYCACVSATPRVGN